MDKERIGLFGGTFNPIHSGHIKAARLVREKFSLDKILFIPSSIPPHKDSSEVASPSFRLKMVELAVTSYPFFIPSSLEIDAEERSYSIITLGKIKKLYPSAQVFFILGIDAFLEIETWKEYKRVLDSCSFVVISRPGYRLGDAKKVLGVQYRGDIIELTGSEDLGKSKPVNFKIFLLPIDALNIASSELRNRIKSGMSISGLVPKAVESYINEKKIYQLKKMKNSSKLSKRNLPQGVKITVKASQAKKSEDIVVLDLSGISSFTDFFIIMHGNSNRQNRAIYQNIELELKKADIRALSVEGKANAEWILMDYGDFIIHIFSETAREYYSLEKLWGDGPRLNY